MVSISLVIALLVVITNLVATYDIKIGLLIPNDQIGFVKYMYGFSTTAGALTIGLDRIKEEQLLPDANITVVWRFDQCEESLAAGLAIELIKVEKVDVLIGPPCSVPAAIVAVVAKYYNIPMVSWGATALDLTEVEKLPTLSRVIGSAYRMGRALKELLLYMGWTRVAIFSTDDKTTRKCYSVAQGAMKHFFRSGIHIVVSHEIDGERPTDDEIDNFLNIFPHLTRIVLLCIDKDEDNRRFTLRAQERGLATEEFVYIVTDYVRDENKTDVWSDNKLINDNRDVEARKSSENVMFNKSDKHLTGDNRNAEARQSSENVMFIEMLLGTDAKLWKLKQDIPKRIKDWPFFYDSDSKSDQYGSLYAPFLHDAVYLYAIALNRTLTDGLNISDGIAVTNHTRHVQFHGMSGHVIIDGLAGREPSFVLKGFGKDGKLQSYLLAEMYKPDGQAVTLLADEGVMWENRGGYVPKWYPKCGWYGELCLSSSFASKFTNYRIFSNNISAGHNKRRVFGNIEIVSSNYLHLQINV